MLRARRRRLLAGVCAAFMLVALCVSGAFIAAEADHDCAGHDCPVCLELQTCLNAIELMGSAPLALGAPTLVFLFLPVLAFVACVRRVPAVTLRTLDVRFDE